MTLESSCLGFGGGLGRGVRSGGSEGVVALILYKRLHNDTRVLLRGFGGGLGWGIRSCGSEGGVALKQYKRLHRMTLVSSSGDFGGGSEGVFGVVVPRVKQ